MLNGCSDEKGEGERAMAKKKKKSVSMAWGAGGGLRAASEFTAIHPDALDEVEARVSELLLNAGLPPPGWIEPIVDDRGSVRRWDLFFPEQKVVLQIEANPQL
jgi:hypothetical protein